MYAARCNGLLALFCLSTITSPTTLASKIDFDAQAQQEILIPHQNAQVVIDGNFDEPVWQHAQEIALDTITSPFDNIASPIKTLAKVITTDEYLLIAFTAYDPEPEKIVASFGERDTRWFDDIVGINIDPLNNRRISYSFFANVYGVQNDETFNEISGNPNELWDGIWHSYGKLTDFGYQVEIAIPFHVLNFDETLDKKAWPFELVRIFPRDNVNRISSVALDRNNPCYLCQYPKAIGFEHATKGNAVQLTPALVGIYNETRDIYDTNADWQEDTDIEPSLDIVWNVDKQNSLNVTLNPDFSTVEADAGQLKVNETFSLFYDEKRSFFLANQPYFESPTNLIYTRNISNPDYGVKYSGTKGSHTYAAFISHDQETNFILSGNLSAQIASLKSESHSGAFRYLYDLNDTTSIGAISTFRKADNYHNYVYGVDARHKISDSDTVKFQLLGSDTLYPDELFQQFDGYGTEQLLRANQQASFSDISYTLNYVHSSEYWQIDANRDAFGEDFRADLGFVNRIDYVNDTAKVMRKFYKQDDNDLWTSFELGGEYQIQHSVDGEFIGKQYSAIAAATGPLLSTVEVRLIDAEKVGLRYLDDSYNPFALAIDGNTERFSQQQLTFYGDLKPNSKTFLSVDATLGDQIDYDNNRLGETFKITGNFTWNPTAHIELDLYHTYNELDADSENVFIANLTDMRFRYYFDAHSAVKLSLVYTDIDYNADNNPNAFYTEQEKGLSTQLIYSYKLNPQTVFFLGYSDASYQDDYVSDLKQTQRTIFTKVSYAWR